jgi:hypothetical protein
LRQQMKIDTHHARLIMLKNTAHTWRQMIFYLSLLDGQSAVNLVHWAEGHLREQTNAFQQLFNPALRGLVPRPGANRLVIGHCHIRGTSHRLAASMRPRLLSCQRLD